MKELVQKSSLTGKDIYIGHVIDEDYNKYLKDNTYFDKKAMNIIEKIMNDERIVSDENIIKEDNFIDVYQAFFIIAIAISLIAIFINAFN